MTLSAQEIRRWLQEEPADGLYAEADRIRRERCGDEVYLRGLVEFSNHCTRNCLYCGLRRGNTAARRYRMTEEEVLAAVATVAGWGLNSVVLQSGDDLAYSREAIGRVLTGIRERWPGMAITLSVGERPLRDYETFKRNGADRYLLKHETANPDLYRRMHPGQSFDRRMGILRLLRSLGYQVGVGFIVGLPGQTTDDLVRDIEFLQDFQPDMAGMGPFLPQSETPLRGHEAGSRDLTLRILALARLVTGTAHLPATTALASVDPTSGVALGLRAGCNVVMLDATPEPYRCDYRIYDKRARLEIDGVRRIVESIGRRASGARGDSLKAGSSPSADSPQS